MRSAKSSGACGANTIMATSNPPTTATRPAAKRTWNAKRWAPYIFISPFFILFAAFGLFPLLFSAYVSFFRWDGISGLSNMRWEGWGNYLYVLQLDDLDVTQIFSAAFWEDVYSRDFWRALSNTLWIGLIAGLPQHLISIPLAVFLHTRLKRMRNTVLALYFLPFITNTVAIVLVFNALFSAKFGVINALLMGVGQWQVAGIAPLAWLFPTEAIDWGRPEKTPWIVAFVVWWRYVGWNTVLYLAALQTIPHDLYEAARVDGASPWRQFVHISLPLLRPMMFFAITLTLIGNLQLFEEPYVLTGGTGGVGQVAETSAMYMLKVAMTDGDFGTASAVAWLLFMVVALLTWINNRVFKPRE
jgi:multiple sugar transport system permease protein